MNPTTTAEARLISRQLAEVLLDAELAAVPHDCPEYSCGRCDACLADEQAYSARTLPASRSE